MILVIQLLCLAGPPALIMRDTVFIGVYETCSQICDLQVVHMTDGLGFEPQSKPEQTLKLDCKSYLVQSVELVR